MNGELKKEDIEKHGQFGLGYLMAVKQCRDILKRIIKDVDAR